MSKNFKDWSWRSWDEIVMLLQIEFEKANCASCYLSNRLTIDHIKPLSKGGSRNKENLQILCIWCNGKKGDTYNPSQSTK